MEYFEDNIDPTPNTKRTRPKIYTQEQLDDDQKQQEQNDSNITININYLLIGGFIFLLVLIISFQSVSSRRRVIMPNRYPRFRRLR